MPLYNLFTLPLYFIYTFVGTMFFTKLLNIVTTKKSKFIYNVLMGFTTFISYFLIKKICIYILYIIIKVFITKFILKISFFKSILSQFFITFLYLFSFKYTFSVFSFSINLVWIPVLIATLLYFLLYLFIRHYNFNLKFDNINKSFLIFIIIVIFIGFLEIIFQFYFVLSEQPKKILITLFSGFDLLAYFAILIYSILSTNKIDSTCKVLETTKLHNSTLSELNNKVRGFKHDFNNIMQGIGGYICCKDYDGLENYYNQLLCDCTQVNNLSTLNPNLINNPAIYSIVTKNYNRCINDGIKMNITCIADLSDINKYTNIYEFSKILGILLDNAREAANECKNKFINLTFKNENNRNRILVIIENSFINKKIDIDKFFEKSFSTKSQKTNSGLGLWEVRQILRKHNNLNLYTNPNGCSFIQQFEIYY